MDSIVQWPVGELTGIGNGETFQIQDDVEGLQAVVDVLDFALGIFPRTLNNIFINQWPHCLCQQRRVEREKENTAGPESVLPRPASKVQKEVGSGAHPNYGVACA